MQCFVYRFLFFFSGAGFVSAAKRIDVAKCCYRMAFMMFVCVFWIDFRRVPRLNKLELTRKLNENKEFK